MRHAVRFIGVTCLVVSLGACGQETKPPAGGGGPAESAPPVPAAPATPEAAPAAAAPAGELVPAIDPASLPVEELILPDQAPLAADGPQARFWEAGLSGLVLTDTAQFRTPFPEGADDTLDKVDFDRLARVTRLLETLVTTLADGLVPLPAPGDPGSEPAGPSEPARGSGYLSK